jgi:hypothetical protein
MTRLITLLGGVLDADACLKSSGKSASDASYTVV